MAIRFTYMEKLRFTSRFRTCGLSGILGITFLCVTATAATAQERIYFPAHDNYEAQLVAKINAENVRLDIAVWLLDDGSVTTAIINRWNAGVPVRVIGDRAGIFESDPHTRASFERLAKAGVPIRLRYYPTSFPEIMHWKYGGFVGQGYASIGSGNWTSFELAPVSSTNFKDEIELLTNDPVIVNALLTKFDRMWVDQTPEPRASVSLPYMLDWPQAYKRETGLDWTTPMNIQRVRLEPDYPTSALIWGQGPDIINAMLAEINAEPTAIDLISYRLTVPSLTDALIAKKGAGVQVRAFIEPIQYRNDAFPEYWLVGYQADRLWTAGIPIKIRTHSGLTHAKTLITSRSALLASSNFTKNWERDHNYFIQAAATTSGLDRVASRGREKRVDAAETHVESGTLGGRLRRLSGHEPEQHDRSRPRQCRAERESAPDVLLHAQSTAAIVDDVLLEGRVAHVRNRR
jgi:phosphatidylserine/phosphatidylglycerophosphate/cardiolipin synthase-like enzyme